MDKYLIPKTKFCKPDVNKCSSTKIYKQTTIQSLSGVVVIEDIEKAKVNLESPSLSTKRKIEILKKLGEKNPSKTVLINTGIGKLVHKLCRDDDIELASNAKVVYEQWKKHICSLVDRPNIEVKCDLKTTNFRNKARHMMLKSLMVETQNDSPIESISPSCNSTVDTNTHTLTSGGKIRIAKYSTQELENLSERIERQVFHLNKKLLNNKYRRTIRTLVFALMKEEVKKKFRRLDSNLESIVLQYFK